MTLRGIIAKLPGARRAYGAWRSRPERARQRRLAALPVGAPDDAPSPEVAADLRALRAQNRRSRRSVVDERGDAVVAMTSYGRRIRTAYLALESIARGDARPRRLVLYLETPDARALPGSLRRLRRRGLEVIGVPSGMGVHTKYYFYVQSIAEHVLPLVTCDDDILYPREWLATLAEAGARNRGQVTTPRAHRIRLDDGRIAPYLSWTPCTSTTPSYLNMATSVSGQFLEPSFLDVIREAGDAFLALCPTADDVWLHHLALRSGRRVVQLTDVPQHYPFVPFTQADGLWIPNVVEGGNDAQIARLYDGQDLAVLASDDQAA